MRPVYLVREQKVHGTNSRLTLGFLLYGPRSRQYMISAKGGLRFRHEEKREGGETNITLYVRVDARDHKQPAELF